MESNLTPLFLDKKVRNRYRNIVMSWTGTPYKHLWMKKGRGADCTLFIAACLKELKILKKIVYDYYPRDWFLHNKKEWVIEAFHRHTNNYIKKRYKLIWFNKKIPKEKFIFGDILAFSTTKMNVTNHCAIWLDNGFEMFNSIRKRGCTTISYGGFWERRLTGLLRIYRVYKVNK